MKRVLWTLLFFSFHFGGASVFAQGSLTPPGAPAPTMKSLDQIEARTPISSLPFTISSSGSYYLTKSLNVTTGNGITINAAQVTVDLNGFTISSTASSANGTGIALASGLADITIFNGHIKGGVAYLGGTYSGPGFANGIEYSGNAPVNVRVTGISVIGCQFDGIYVGTNSVVESCTVQTIGGDGIVGGGVFRSTATQCGNGGIAAHTASDCYALATGSGTTLSAVNAINCEGQSTGGIGLYAYTASNCYGSSTSGTGMSVVTTAINCQGVSSGDGDGLHAQTASNCYGSTVTEYGVYADVAANCKGVASGSGIGLGAVSATGCFGQSGSNDGIYSEYIATDCVGLSFGSGAGLSADIAIGCYGQSSSGTAVSANHKYNMP
jgi:hypothetical protein